MKHNICTVVDINGVAIRPGQVVKVYQTPGVRKAVVIQSYPDSPCVQQEGYKGIDLCIGKGTRQNVELALDIGRKKRNFEIVE